MKKFQTKTLYLIAIVLISIIGGVLVIYSTANGPWGNTDPVAYISTARSLANGQGLGYYEANAAFKAYTIQPPFYSIVLSAFGLLGINLVAAARWFNTSAFVASIFIAGWILFRFSRVPALGIIASAMLCAFPFMVVMSSSAYSEPLFILLVLSGGLYLLYYLQHDKLYDLILCGLLFGVLPLTRYVGIAMIISAGLSILLFSSGKAWSQVKKAILFVIVASLPILIWLGWVYFSTAHSIGGRSLELNWGSLAARFQAFRGIFMDTVWKWVPFQSHKTLLRYIVRVIITGIGLVIILILSILAEHRIRKASDEDVINSGIHIFVFFGLTSLTFIGVLIATYLFTHPTIDIDNRMFLPFYVITIMNLLGGVALWHLAWFKGRMQILQIFPWLIAVICVAWYIPQTLYQMEFYHAGDGLTAYHWDHSTIVQAVRAVPSDQPVISNDWELLMLWTGRPIHGFWNSFPPEPLQKSMYGTDPRDNTQYIFCGQGAMLVIFNDFPTQFSDQVGDSYKDQWSNMFEGLTVFGVYTDGTIYLCH